MRTISLLFLLAPIVALCAMAPAGDAADQVPVPETIVNDGIPPIPIEIQQKMNPYSEMKSASFASWVAAGNGMIISTRLGNTWQLYLVASPLAEPAQLTDYKEPVYSATSCPDPATNYFVFGKDVGGGENYQFFRYDAATRKTELITDGKSRNSSALFDHKGAKMAFASNARTGKLFDIVVMDPQNPAGRKVVFEALVGAYYSPAAWFYDDRRLVVVEHISINESNSYIVDTETGESRKINPGTAEKCRFEIAAVAPDGRTAYGLSDRSSEMTRFIKVDLETNAIEAVTKNIPWEIDAVAVSEDFQTAAFVANESGVKRLYLMDVRSGAYKAADSVPVCSISRMEFDRSGKKLAITISSARVNKDVFVLDVATGRLGRWTRSDTAGVDPSQFAEPVVIEYPTFDTVDGKARMIPAFYYRPNGKSGEPSPVVIYIHGGPEDQFTPKFDPNLSYFIEELGIAVLAPNVRGSSGYGKTYLLLDNAEKREDSVKDIGALLDWIAGRPELDSDRVAVAGGSYGGYMVLASMVHFSDRLACGVDIFGVSNFVTFLKNTSEYRQDLRRVEYGDERVIGDFLNDISPLTRASKITKPLLVVQGKNDPRVPWTESEQMVKTLRANGVPVWYLTATNEGHGFAKKDNSDYMYYTISRFLEEFLLK
jgi:dipeptidyl aminopeptidase/acylaminoacyl peptidase